MARRWKSVLLLRALFLLEFLLLTTLLGLFGYAHPDTFSSRLREDGALNGFNSSPTSSATTPFVWTQFLTKYNLALSVSSFLSLVAQVALHILEFYIPALAAVVNTLLVAAWAVSVSGQAGADNTDPRHPSPSPWFLRKGCGVVYYSRNRNYCYEAKASFGVSVALMAVYVGFVVLAVVSIGVGKEVEGKEVEVEDEERRNDSLEMEDGRGVGLYECYV